MADVAFWVLQLSPAAADRARLDPTGQRLQELPGPLADFADLASVVAQLDLVIGVDADVVHLAGALGRPVWLLLPFVAHWRWQRDREDSPWYPTMRLFRERQPGDWAELLDRVAEAMAVAASCGPPASSPAVP